MSEHRDLHRLRRGLVRATVDAVESRDRRRATRRPRSASDVALQVQCPVNGKVGRSPVFIDLDVILPEPLWNRVVRSQTNTTPDPHFALGVHLLTGPHVIIDAQVREWIDDDSSLITGAKVRVSVWSPSATRSKKFSAVVHLTFFGYGGPIDDDTEG